MLGPVEVARGERRLIAYRWLGAGRGQDYVQVELDRESGDVTVYGARGHDALPPWTQPGAQGGV